MFFLSIYIFTLFAELIANDQPLLVKYKNQYYFPIFKTYQDKTFGGDFPTPADYRDNYTKREIKENGWMIMLIIPFSYNTVDYELNVPTPSASNETHLLGTDDEEGIFLPELSMEFVYLLFLLFF